MSAETELDKALARDKAESITALAKPLSLHFGRPIGRKPQRDIARAKSMLD